MGKVNLPDKPELPWQNCDPRVAANALYKFVTIYAGVVTPITRCGFGSRALYAYFFTLLLMFAFSGLGRCPQLLLYLPVWSGFVTYRAMTINHYEHSQQRGWPWLACLLPWVDNFDRGRLVEALIVMAVGWSLQDYHQNLGGFIFGAGVSLLAVMRMEQMYWRVAEISRRDAETLADQYRQMS
jgi:hypothetical protein